MAASARVRRSFGLCFSLSLAGSAIPGEAQVAENWMETSTAHYLTASTLEPH